MHAFGIDKLAVQFSKKSPEQLEHDANERQQRRWSWLSIATMIVSFIHMVAALSLFSDGSFFGNIAAILMTALVDGATWVVANYKDYSKRRNKQRSWLVSTLLYVALFISFSLNLAYLLIHRPVALPPLVAYGIALAFSLFIPLCIAVASLARGELEDDKTHMGDAQMPKIREVADTAFVPLESHNDSASVLPEPAKDREIKPRAGNGKSDILYNDSAKILAILRENNIQTIDNASELARQVGWSSPSTGAKALAHLRANGYVDERGNVVAFAQTHEVQP